MDYDKSTPEDVVAFNSDGIRIYGLRKPTIEKDLHIELYQARDDINAVIHHPFNIFHRYRRGWAGFAGGYGGIRPDHRQGSAPVQVRHTGFTGSGEIRRRSLRRHQSCGAAAQPMEPVCGGRDIKMALKQCDVLERNAEIYILARSLGGKVRIIPDDDVDHMFRFHNNQYGQ